jgi:diguanylate cyclase (GGDEF)-like protein
MKDTKYWLLQTELFSPLDEEGLKLVSAHCSEDACDKGEILFSEGARGENLYILTKGTVEVFKTDTDRNISVIAELTPGNIIGELEYFTGKPYNASATASEQSSLIKISGSLKDELESRPEISAAVLYRFLKTFSARLRKANTLVKENSALVQELKRQVYGDKLTGLYNKTYLEETLPGLITDRSKPVGLLLMKPDNFKMINDTFGHEAGDDTLKIMAAALNRFTGYEGTVLRYMGNELGVILPGFNREMTLKMAEAILKMFNELDISSATGDKTVFLSMSIGAALFPEHADIADDLILKAHDIPLVGRERGGNMILFPEDI